MENYSVLMSVYFKEQPDFLRQSIESMLSQNIPTNDFVLVCDGPLTAELDAVIESFQLRCGEILQVVRTEVNQGLSHALNHGLPFCKNDLVARMDSDDIAPSDRCELQLKKFAEDPQLTIVGGSINEFEGNITNIVSRKEMPLRHEDVLRYAKKRNPFNHPTVMYRKSAVLAVGSYPHITLHEDYALWANLIMAGAKVCNLPQTLCNMRVDGGLYNRRGGLKYIKTILTSRYNLYRIGFYSLWNFLYVTSALTIVALVPQGIRRFIYRKILRRS